MDSIVLELQRDALDATTKASDLLKKALLVAKKLRLEEFEGWILKELNGYENDEPGPPYRLLRGTLMIGILTEVGFRSFGKTQGQQNCSPNVRVVNRLLN